MSETLHNIEIKRLYAVHQGDDDRSSGYPRWYFDNAMEATKVAIGRGWWGGNAPVSEKKCLVIDGITAYLLASDVPISINEGPDDELTKKQKILAKLTEEEKKILGVKIC